MEGGNMEEDEMSDLVDYLMATDASDFITMANALVSAFESTGYGVGKVYKNEEGRDALELHTNGWSECEEIIDEIGRGHRNNPPPYRHFRNAGEVNP